MRRQNLAIATLLLFVLIVPGILGEQENHDTSPSDKVDGTQAADSATQQENDALEAQEPEQLITSIKVTDKTYDSILKDETYPKVAVFCFGEDRISSKFFQSLPKLKEELAKKKIGNILLAHSHSKSSTLCTTREGHRRVPALNLHLTQTNQKHSYKGYFVVEDVVAWIVKQSTNPRLDSKEFQTGDEFYKFTKEHQSLVCFFGTDRNSAEFALYLKISSKKKEYQFIHTFNSCK